MLSGYGSGDWIRTGDTSGMNRMLWPTELRHHRDRPRQARITITGEDRKVNMFFEKICEKLGAKKHPWENPTDIENSVWLGIYRPYIN